jgi:hypothetical protein
MPPCSGRGASHVSFDHENGTTQSDGFDCVLDAATRATTYMVGTANARSLFRATCILAPLSLALLAGCEQLPEGCAGLAESSASANYSSKAQQRAALAIDCDAQLIINHVSSVAVAEADRISLHDRTRELANAAREAVRVGSVESSRLPLSSAHQQMYAVAAEAEDATGSPAFSAWGTDPWEPLRPLERPADGGAGTLSTALMPGERRSLALNVRSTLVNESKFWIQVNLTGLRPDAIQIYQVNWTGNDRSEWTAAELESLGDASSMREASILPGVTRQIWIQVHPDITTGAGLLLGNVSLSTPGGETTQVPIDIKVFKTPFPRPSMHFGGWDYSFVNHYAVRETNRAQLVEYLQSRYVDTPWAQRTDKVMHWENLDANGNSTAPLDSSALEAWLSQWPSARRFRVHLHVDDHIAGIPATDARFTHAVATWAQAWATEIRRFNRAPEQFDLLLVDEPQTDEQFRITELWATAIRQSGAGFRIWTDLIAKDPAQIPESMFDVVDTVAVYLGLAELRTAGEHQSWARTFSQRGKTLELYTFDGPARRLDPYTYYRLTPWRAFFLSATAASFWSFTDNGGTPSDNEFAADDIDYSPLFVSDERVRPGKHMEAAAEGVQDAQYLEMLKQVATTHAVESVRRQAQRLLDEAAVFVYRSPKSSNAEWRSKPANAQWRSQREANGADEHRVQIGDFLDSLTP